MKAKQVLKYFRPHTKCYSIGISTISKENVPPEVDHMKESQEPRLKCRYIVTLIGFVIFFFLSGYRMNMSVSIVAMVNNSAETEQSKGISYSCSVPAINLTNESLNSKNAYTQAEQFRWSPQIQGYILGSYFLIYVIVQVPFGKLVERYGSKWFVFGGTFVAAIATILIPVASKIHPYALILMQLFRGAGQGVYQPSVSLIAANWFPRMERGLLYGIIVSGSTIGAFAGSIFSGLLCKSSVLGGWPSSFYLSGVAGLVFSFVVAYFLHESPDVHPRISEAERKYILSNQENALSQRRPDPPWRQIFSSAPVYALTIGYFGQLWAISQFLIVNSTFLGTILHYSIDENGVLSAVPFLVMFLFSQVSSWVSSFLTSRKYASIDLARKSCNFIASLGFCLCLLGVYFSGCNKYWSSIFTILSVGFTGFGLSGVWIVSTDMSPTFAASVNAFSCTFGCLSSFVLPLVVGYLTNERQTMEQWNKVFFVGIGVVMASAFIFSIFGSAEVQPWNSVEDNQKKEDDKDIRY